MDYIKTVKRKNFDNQDKYLLARVKAGVEVGYTFEQCYDHWKKEKEKRSHPFKISSTFGTGT